MSNWEQIVGHGWAVQMLADGLANDRLGHAYLITGPEQVGKTTLARTFAQALNCEASVGERPCGHCRPCKLIGVDRHPDVKLVSPEVSGRGKLTLKIETIRQLQQDLNLSAYEARYKVAILERFDAATIGAANAFLKTLEEPPGKVVLLLTATDADMLLPTISSRCRTLNLRPLSPDLIEQHLATQLQVPAEKATLLAHLADGRLGWAIRAAKDETILQTRAEQLAYLHDALAGQRAQRFALADKLARKPETLPSLLKTWLSWWRDLTLLNQRQGQPISLMLTNVDEIERLEPLATAWNELQITGSLNQTNQALWQLERNANTRLVLENLLLLYPLPESA
ncbi:DNA polymerase III subunit delta' [Candidatus Leptofilum sp.]|uniref:DNA polymerase III subunit delta' n=1 Tax=Candidatus Leptofilum sp. TaxID=3241576 RepID=UPI003B591045